MKRRPWRTPRPKVKSGYQTCGSVFLGFALLTLLHRQVSVSISMTNPLELSNALTSKLDAELVVLNVTSE